MTAREPLLIVEDEPRLLRDLARGLKAEGYSVLPAADVATARRVSEGIVLSAAILDRMLPDGDGLEYLRELHATRPGLPAVVVTARDAVRDRIAGLDAGADDYLVKPFAFAELLARLRAVLRRAEGVSAALRVGGVELDLVRRTIFRGGDAVALTPRQCELLGYLLRHAGRPIGREALLRDVWDEPPGSGTNVVEVSVNHLRRKFQRRGWPPMIETVRGEGYLFRDEPCED